ELKGAGIFNLTTKEKKQLQLTDLEKKLVKPFYSTQELFQYNANSKNSLWVIYTDSTFKDPKKLKPYPGLKKHLDIFKKVITSYNAPYGLHRSRDEKFFKGEKIMSLRKCAKPTF